MYMHCSRRFCINTKNHSYAWLVFMYKWAKIAGMEKVLRQLAASPRLVLIGSFGAGNIGDELILAGFLKKLRAVAPRARVTVLSGNPSRATALHEVEAAPLVPAGVKSIFLADTWKASVKALRGCDAVIFPGGGLFTDEETAYAPFLWAVQLLAARLLWKPVYLCGQSIGPFNYAFTRFVARLSLKRAAHIYCRDKRSMQQLDWLGIEKKYVSEGTDSALLLQKPKRKKTARPKNMLIIPKSSCASVPQYLLLAQAAINNGMVVTVATFDYRDTRIAQKLARRGLTARRLPLQPRAILAALEQYDAIVSSRLHGLIAGHLAGSRTIAVSTSAKVDAWQESHGAFALRPRDITPDIAEKVFRSMIE